MEVPAAHVVVGRVEADDEVLGEDVLGVLRVDEHVREGGRGISDVLGALEFVEQLGDQAVDRGPFLRLGGVLLRTRGVDRCLVCLVVDDQRRDLPQIGLRRLQVPHELLQHSGVLLDDGDANVGRVDVLLVIERPRRIDEVIGLPEVEVTEAGLEELVVVLGTGKPSDAREPELLRILPVGDEPALLPVDVAVSDVVDRRDELVIVTGNPAEDVLLSDELHVQTALRLSAQQLDRAGEDDDELVAGVDRLGDHPGEVGGLPGLDMADDQAFGLVRVAPRGVGQALDHFIGSAVELADGVGAPALPFEDAAVTVPIEGSLGDRVARVPRVPVGRLARNHHGTGHVDWKGVVDPFV